MQRTVTGIHHGFLVAVYFRLALRQVVVFDVPQHVDVIGCHEHTEGYHSTNQCGNDDVCAKGGAGFVGFNALLRDNRQVTGRCKKPGST